MDIIYATNLNIFKADDPNVSKPGHPPPTPVVAAATLLPIPT